MSCLVFNRKLVKKLLASTLLLGLVNTTTAGTDNSVPAEDPQKGYVEPFKMFDNVY